MTDKGRLLSRNFHLDGGVWSGSDILYYDATTGKWWADSASTGHTHDHGGLTGLSDDDHTQYLLITGSRAMSGNLDLGGNLIVSNGSATGIFVSDPGNVGIGTTAPGSALEVNGDIGFDYGATNNSILMPGSLGTSSMKHTQSNGEINFKAMGAFIFNSQGSVVTFQTAGVERARFSSTGLGIGTTSPEALLHVQDGATSYSWTHIAGSVATFEGTDNNRAFVTVVGKSTGQSELWFADEALQNAGRVRYDHVTDSMVLYTAGTSALTVGSGHNVGIGITPGTSYALQVAASLGSSGGVYASSVGTDDWAFVYAGGTNDGSGLKIHGANGSSLTLKDGTTTKVFLSSIANSYINTGYNFGIGTTTPGVELHVQMTNARCRLYAEGTNNPVIWLGGGISSTARYGQVGLDYSASEVFLAYGSGGSNRAIQIDSSQRVGLGKSPGYDLHIYTNDTATDAALLVEQDSTGDCMMGFLLSATRQWSVGIDNSDSDSFKISPETALATNTIMTMKTVGTVGFGGVTNPQEDLHANDTIRADQRFNHNGTDGGTSNPTVTWTDGGGQSHEVTIGGGIVTSWLIDSSEQLI